MLRWHCFAISDRADNQQQQLARLAQGFSFRLCSHFSPIISRHKSRLAPTVIIVTRQYYCAHEETPIPPFRLSRSLCATLADTLWKSIRTMGLGEHEEGTTLVTSSHGTKFSGSKFPERCPVFLLASRASAGVRSDSQQTLKLKSSIVAVEQHKYREIQLEMAERCFSGFFGGDFSGNSIQFHFWAWLYTVFATFLSSPNVGYIESRRRFKK